MIVKAVIDRFEGNKAVLLLGNEEQQASWPRDMLPPGVKSGDYLTFTVSFDKATTEEAHQEASDLLKKILEQNK